MSGFYNNKCSIYSELIEIGIHQIRKEITKKKSNHEILLKKGYMKFNIFQEDT